MKHLNKTIFIKTFSFLLLLPVAFLFFGKVECALAGGFSDTDESPSTFSAGILQFSLSPGIWEDDGDSKIKNIAIKNDGDLDFQYDLDITVSGDDGCENLHFTAELGGEQKYSGNLGSFSLTSPALLEKGKEEIWHFTVQKDEYDSLQCEISYTFEGWQENLNKGQGFTYEDAHSNHLEISSITTNTNSEVIVEESGDEVETVAVEVVEEEETETEVQEEEEISQEEVQEETEIETEAEVQEVVEEDTTTGDDNEQEEVGEDDGGENIEQQEEETEEIIQEEPEDSEEESEKCDKKDEEEVIVEDEIKNEDSDSDSSILDQESNKE